MPYSLLVRKQIGYYDRNKRKKITLKSCSFKPGVMPGFMVSGAGDFNPGSETRLNYLELLCGKVLLKYNRDRESF